MNLKKTNDISVLIVGSPNDISIRMTAGSSPHLTCYNDMVKFNRNIEKFFTNENIDISKLKPFIGAGSSKNLYFDTEQTVRNVGIDEKYRDKLIKDEGGAKAFNEKYGDNSTKVLNNFLDLKNTKISDIVKKGGFTINLQKGKITIPTDKLHWFYIDSPTFAFSLKDNYNLVKNAGAVTEISTTKNESFVNDINVTINLLNNITSTLEGGQILDKEIKDLSSDLIKQAIKFKKNLKILIKNRIDELKNAYNNSNEKPVIEAYLNNLKDILKSL